MLNLATKLTESGVFVEIDEWDTQYGDDLPGYMETGVRESRFVVMVCTPTYARKANAGKGGAGYEKQIVTGEMLHGANASKFIPLVRKGSDDEALPSFLKSRKYIDFREDTEFGEKLKDLLHQLHQVPKHPRPPLGQSPFSAAGLHRTPGLLKTTMPELPPPLDMALIPPQTKHNAETATYCEQCGVFPGGAQSECTGLMSSSHSFVTRSGVIYCTCCGKTAGVRSICIKLISTAHSFVSGDGTEYCKRCGVGLDANVNGCVGLQACHDFVKRSGNVQRRKYDTPGHESKVEQSHMSDSNIIGTARDVHIYQNGPEHRTFRTIEKYTDETRLLLQNILGLIRHLDENFTPMNLTNVVRPLRDQMTQFYGVEPSLSRMSPDLSEDLRQLFGVLGMKENGWSRVPGFEVASKMFLTPQTRSFISKVRTDLDEGLREHG